MAVRPSGTEPKIKCYIEIRVAPDDDVDAARARAEARRHEVTVDAGDLLQRGPN